MLENAHQTPTHINITDTTKRSLIGCCSYIDDLSAFDELFVVVISVHQFFIGCFDRAWPISQLTNTRTATIQNNSNKVHMNCSADAKIAHTYTRRLNLHCVHFPNDIDRGEEKKNENFQLLALRLRDFVVRGNRFSL